jgi:hypothetical protein
MIAARARRRNTNNIEMSTSPAALFSSHLKPECVTTNCVTAHGIGTTRRQWPLFRCPARIDIFFVGDVRSPFALVSNNNGCPVDFLSNQRCLMSGLPIHNPLKPYTLWFPRWPKIPSIKIKPSARDLVVPSE